MGAKRVTAIGNGKHKRDAAFARLKKDLESEYACFVLITCAQPSSEGKMDVEMNYEGDETLAAFLIENASQVFEEKNLSRETK